MTSKHAAPTGLSSWLRSRKLWIVAAAVLVWALGGVALAFWQSSDSSNPAAAVGDSLPQGATPTGTVSNATTVSVNFARAVTTTGRNVTSYKVNRYSAPSGGTPAATFTCSWPSGGSLGCSESNVPGGVWYYTDTPAIAGSLWVGTESSRSAAVAIDSQAPTVVASGSPAANANGWNNTAVTLTLTATDEAGGSGVKSISYAVDGGATVTVTGSSTSISLSTDGVHSVSYFATDNAGNAGSAQTATVRIDRVLPTASATVTPTPNANGYNKVSPVTVNLSATDAASGVESLTYKVDSGSNVTVSGSTAAVSVSGDGPHTVTYFAIDKAGNSTGNLTQNVKIDTVAPAAPTLTVPTYVNSANVTSVPVSGTAEAGSTVTLTVTDAGAAHTVPQTATANTSGAWSTTVNLNAAPNVLNEGTITFSATATDAAGNVSAARTTTDTKDTVGPALSTVTSTNGDGLMQSGDALALTFTEAIDSASLPASPVTVTLSRSGNSTSLSIPGVILTISNSSALDPYQSKNSTTTAPGTVTLTGNKVTVTLGTLTTTGSGSGPTAGSGAVPISPASSLRDVAGNGAQSTSANLARLW